MTHITLGNVIDNGLIVKNFEEVTKPDEKFAVKLDEERCRKQTQLVKAIVLAQSNLRDCLKAKSDFHCISYEEVTRFGRVDLVAQDENTIYPIEVKTSGADHGVVSQVDKYIITYKLNLLHKIYSFVVGVVIANGFDTYVLQELCRIGAVAIKYKFKSSQKVELVRL